MVTLTIRNLDESTKAQLRIQAARHGRSMEEEARTILRDAIQSSQPGSKAGRSYSRPLRSVGRCGAQPSRAFVPAIPSPV